MKCDNGSMPHNVAFTGGATSDWRFATASYSITSGTETTISNKSALS